jgi:hypothetical protein
MVEAQGQQDTGDKKYRLNDVTIPTARMLIKCILGVFIIFHCNFFKSLFD